MRKYGSEQYVAIGAAVRATSVGGSLYGLPDREPAPEVIERNEDWKPATLYAPNKSDVDVRLAQFVRVSGLRGVAVLERTVTARGYATRNVPSHLSGLCPDERCNFIPDTADPLTESELRQASRYRNSMKGAKFANAMSKAANIRDHAWWRNACPWRPLDKAGRMMQGFQLHGETHYDINGNVVSLRSLMQAHFDSVAATDRDAESRQRDRAAELRALIQEQAEDAKRQRKGKA